jgi:CheY-like chemotaxis protein
MTDRYSDTDKAPLVLVVDDDWDVQDALADTLQHAGFKVTCATNGEEALNFLERHPAPDAILLDLFMPVMNGWETVRAIRSRSQLNTIPLIVITATEPHWGYPTSRVLRKPIDADRLVRTVRDAISHPSSLPPHGVKAIGGPRAS